MAIVQASAEIRQSHPKPFLGYIPELDVIRAFGITMVICAHTWPNSAAHHRGWDVLSLSWTLMDSFFVLSGFLIGGILFDSRSEPDYFRSFYTRRAFRILPIYYLLISVLTLANALFGSGYLYGSIPALHVWGSPWWFFAYLGNIPPAISGAIPTAAKGAFQPLWSLQVEEQFYLLFPLLVYRLKPTTLGRALLCLACVSPLLRILLYVLVPNNLYVQYILLPCRMDVLALGAWAALQLRLHPWMISKRTLTLLTIAMVALSLFAGAQSGFVFTRPFNRTIGYLMSSVASMFVVVWLVVFRGSRLTVFFRLPIVRYLAKLSYSAYLFHIPVAIVLMALATRFNLTYLFYEHYLRVAVVYCVTIIVSSLSWRFIERPLLRLRERLA